MGDTPQSTRPHLSVPAWVIVTLGGLVTGGAILWASSLYDDRGDPILDGPAVQLLLGLLGLLATILTLLLKRTSEVRHELRPNSGTSHRDVADRTEAIVRDIRRDVGGMRAELRNLREVDLEQAREISRVRTDVSDIDDKLDRHLTDTADLIAYVRNKKEKDK